MDLGDIWYILWITYLKLIRTIVGLIGNENLIVLEMVSSYYKFFDIYYIVRKALIVKFEYIWYQIYDNHADISRPAITVSYAFTYTVYYILDYPIIALDIAKQLQDAAVGSAYFTEPSTKWAFETEAFVFASKTIAEMYR